MDSVKLNLMLSPDGWLTVPAIRIAESRCKMRQLRILLLPPAFSSQIDELIS